MDPETSSAIESLRQDLGQRITAVEDGLRGEIRGLRTELRDELHDETGKLRGEIRELRHELRGEMQELRGEMQEMREELMRHAMVLTDSVRDDIRIVAEGLTTVSAKLDALKR